MIEEMSLWDLFDAVDEIMDKEIYRDDENDETDEIDDDLLLCPEELSISALQNGFYCNPIDSTDLIQVKSVNWDSLTVINKLFGNPYKITPKQFGKYRLMDIQSWKEI